MKKITTIYIILLGTFCFSQQISYQNIKQFIGNRVNEFEDFYNIKSDKIDDNFGNLTVLYNNKIIDDSEYTITLKTKDKNITDIVLVNSKDRTPFFKQLALDLENTTKAKKNYKTIFYSIIKNSNKRKIYYNDVEEMITKLKETNLTENTGQIESEKLKSTLIINNNETILYIN